jgi:hypothetical protein
LARHRNILDEIANATIKVWVEDYDLSKSDALEKLLDCVFGA